MLRVLVLLLALANAGYYAWSQGVLRDWGLGPGSSAEPQRLQQQIKPDAVRILPASEARRPAPPASAAASATVSAAALKTECLLAGPIVEAKLASVKDALAAWPAGSWNLVPVVQPASWVVYMGKYAGVEQLARKKAELRERGVAFDDIGEPSLQPGISLGRFTSEAEATKRLQALAQSGVHTAHVVQEHPEMSSQQLTLPAVDDALRPRVEALRPVLEGMKLRPCRPAGDTP
jgi:hypothetical protein